MLDKDLESLIIEEEERQNDGIELIASENYPSIDVMEAQGSILTAKYAEGYPGNRYYGGCEIVDKVESLAIERAKTLFGAEYVNVQPHSGSQANFAAYRALLPNGGKIISLELNDGGHLTHGSPVSFSSHLYEFCHYPLNDEGRLDYRIIEDCLYREEPDLLVAGYSSYPYAISFKKIREAVDRYKEKTGKELLMMVDMAHIAGLVAAGACESPVPYADVVTSTTHKTLRGPRGGLILSRRKDLAKALDSAVFPYAQGGPLEHVIGAKAICFKEDAQDSFKEYIGRVLENTAGAANRLTELGIENSGSENHLFLINVYKIYGVDGRTAAKMLGEIGITVNKNMLHGDTLPPAKCSGIRLGFAAATSRGCTLEQAREIASIIDRCLKGEDKKKLREETLAIARSWKKIKELRYLK